MVFDVQINDRGQITIPKDLREMSNLHASDKLKLSMDENGHLVLYKPDFFDDVEDLIRKDLESEGFSGDELYKKIPVRKKELAQALLKMANEVNDEIEQGEYMTFEHLKEELGEKE